MVKKKASNWTLLCLAMTGVTIALVVAESGLRFFVPHLLLSSSSGRPSLVLDDELGWNQAPPVIRLGEESENLRVHFIGDSYTDYDSKWPGYFSTALSERGIGNSVSVGGVAGFGTYQSLLKLEADFREVSPHVVILLVYLWNDLRDNAAHPPIYYNLSTARRPYLVWEEGAFHHQPMLARPWYRHFALTAAVSRALELGLIRYAGSVDWLERRGSSIPIDSGHPFTWLDFYTPDSTSSYVENAWAVFEESLKRIVTLTQSRGADLCVLGIDNAFTVDQDVKEKHIKDPEIQIRLPLDRLERITRRLNIAYFDAQPALLARRMSLPQKIYDEPPGNLAGHLKPEGELVVAEVAKGCVAKRLLTTGTR